MLPSGATPTTAVRPLTGYSTPVGMVTVCPGSNHEEDGAATHTKSAPMVTTIGATSQPRRLERRHDGSGETVVTFMACAPHHMA